MAITWVVVANRGEMTVHRSRGPGRPMGRVEHVEHPEGRLRPQDLDADRPGMTGSSAYPGTRAMLPEQQAHEKVADDFARWIAARLDSARQRDDFDRLVLVAPPDLLGRLRKAMNAPTRQRVMASIGKNLTDADEPKLRECLEDVLRL